VIPERRLLHEELNVSNRIVVRETCVIVFVKFVWISQMTKTHFVDFEESIPIVQDILFNLLNKV